MTRRAAEVKQIAKQCATSKSAWMLPYTSTANTARDMDRIRVALGESKISYAGASWGTHLGAVYTPPGFWPTSAPPAGAPVSPPPR